MIKEGKMCILIGFWTLDNCYVIIQVPIYF